jgi:hypothetical protein
MTGEQTPPAGWYPDNGADAAPAGRMRYWDGSAWTEHTTAPIEQRFVLHARSRRIARIIGYPAGLGILVAGALIDFGATTTFRDDPLAGRVILGFCGLGTLLWTWSVDRRKRIEVTEQAVTVVNTFSRYDVPWRQLRDVSLEEIKNQAGGTAYHRLAFVTSTKRIVAESPAGSQREMMKIRFRILQARHQSWRTQPQSDAGIAVKGAAAVADRLAARLSKYPRLKGGLIFTGLVLLLAGALWLVWVR